MSSPHPRHSSHVTKPDSLVITIDGPAASGKGTISHAVAKRYGLVHIDSGACYRAVAWLATQHKLPLDQIHADKLLQLIQNNPIQFLPQSKSDAASSRIMVGKTDVTELIRNPQIAEAASYVGGLQPIRHYMLDLQRNIAKQQSKGAVLEGRDTGSVVYPEADIKFFLTASIEARALRRMEDYQASGQSTTFEQVYQDIAQRDRRDTERAYSALRIADGAIIVDSTNNSHWSITVEQICQHIDRYLEEVKSQKAKGKG